VSGSDSESEISSEEDYDNYEVEPSDPEVDDDWKEDLRNELTIAIRDRRRAAEEFDSDYESATPTPSELDVEEDQFVTRFMNRDRCYLWAM
jgi:hypothetical protein